MNITIHIPHWLLYVGAALGAIAFIVVCFFAYVGYSFAKSWNNANI